MSGPPPPPPPGPPPPPVKKKEKPKKQNSGPADLQSSLKKWGGKGFTTKGVETVEKTAHSVPVFVKRRLREEVETVVQTYGHLEDYKLHKLPLEGHLGLIEPLVVDPQRTIIALDFDQTLTYVEKIPGQVLPELHLRGGEETRQAIHRLHSLGAEIVVVTAQPPGIQVVHNLEKELQHLGIASVFGVETWDRQPIYDLIQTWGDNDTMPLRTLTKKLATLLVLGSTRFPIDLERLGGPSKMTFQAPTKELHSGMTKVVDPRVDPVKALREYIQRTAAWRDKVELSDEDEDRQDPLNDGGEEVSAGALDSATYRMVVINEITGELSWGAKQHLSNKVPTPTIHKALSLATLDSSDSIVTTNTDPRGGFGYGEEIEEALEGEEDFSYEEEDTAYENRLFLDWDPDEMPVPYLSGEVIKGLVRETLQEAGIETRFAQDVLEEAVTLPSKEGVVIARKRNIFASRYNKPEAVELFAAEHPSRNRVVFVDDSSDNVWKMFDHFALQRTGTAREFGVLFFSFSPEQTRPSLH